MKSGKTVCVDLDGVLNLYAGWEGETHFAPMREGAHEFLTALNEHYRVVVLTTRDARRVLKWLWEHDLPFVEVANEKLPAHVYLDDRAICFRGSFDGLLDQIQTFKTHWEVTASGATPH